jgi:hypothetical protein
MSHLNGHVVKRIKPAFFFSSFVFIKGPIELAVFEDLLYINGPNSHLRSDKEVLLVEDSKHTIADIVLDR